MLTKKRSRTGASARPVSHARPDNVSRRSFLARSGIAGVSVAGALTALSRLRARAQELAPGEPKPAGITKKKTICPFCSVGCSIWAEVQNGVWIGQEPAFESPINMGTHCAKGAATRELGSGERRLKYPMKKVAGKWQRISWDQAVNEIGDQVMAISRDSGPDSVFWCGSSKFSNEAAYLHRKFVAMFGTNNCDHQARICHSTTVAGVAATYGYGAMTNSFNDIQKSRIMLLMGGNPAEAHPVAMQHILRAKENGSKLIVVDPRFTRTAAHANEYARIRSGTDVAFTWGLVREILSNGWEDKDYIAKRVFAFDDVRKEVEAYTPEETANITGIPAGQIRSIARQFATTKPGTLIWCMGLTQSTIGTSKVRAASILQLALGNIGVTGGGANIFRGHDNVQGATDIGSNPESLPGYYGVSEGAWQHWAGVWDIDYNWLIARFKSKKLMETKGTTISRWFDAVALKKEEIDQPNPVRAMIYWGHAPNSQSRGPAVKKSIDAVELLVVVDPMPSGVAALADRPDNFYLLPAATTMEMAGSVTNSQRAVQWREKVIEPLFESKSDLEIMYRFAQKFGYAEQMCKHIKVVEGEPDPEDVLREINRGTWSIGYTGQSPERLQLHMHNQDKFDPVTTIGTADPVKGEYYGLPWPCWGTPELKHPGTPLLYDMSKPVAEGGLPFRANWGVEYKGQSLLADKVAPPDSAVADGYPEFSMAMLDKLGWSGELTPQERSSVEGVARRTLSYASKPGGTDEQRQAGEQHQGQIHSQPFNTAGPNEGPGAGEAGNASGQAVQQAPLQQPDPALKDAVSKVNWKTDLSGGIIRVAIAHGMAPYGNGRARSMVWNFPDPVPKHREPLYTPRRDLLAKYRTYDDGRDWRVPNLYWSIQKNDFSQQYPLVLTSGRIVEYEGGGDETRSISWLAEFQQRMYAEIHPVDAERAGISDGNDIWIESPEGARVRVSAHITRGIGPGTIFMPFHFAGFFQGRDMRSNYPEGTVPYVVGESANTATTYGYDAVTMMQETKTTLCRVLLA